ncbi:Cryptochrome DASH [Durusdinium trenchii]|uniref:Chloroplastic/mitochondrial n=1 Tax=Durusdinium trenchii TaxID=1381693 RepID=A0ABP0MB61_9DINO
MFSPARVTSSPIDEAQLTGKRKTHMKALIEGSSQVLIEDDYKESEDPHRLLQERWTGETWFEISSAQASSGPQKRAPKLGASKAVKKKAKATPLEGEDTAANETTGSGAVIPMPDESLQEALRERGPDAVDGIPGNPVSGPADHSGNHCKVQNCQLPGGHEGPHQDPNQKRFTWDPYNGRVDEEDLIDESPQGTERNNGDEVAPNVHFLGHYGVASVVGLKVLSRAAQLAKEQKLPVLPVYFLDPRQFQSTKFGTLKTGAFRALFLLQSVRVLKRRLRAIGSDLLIQVGKPEELLPKLLAEKSIVLTQEEVTSEELRVDDALRQALQQKGCEAFEYCWGSTLFHKDDLPYQKDLRDAPDVFTTFKNQVEPEMAARVNEVPETFRGGRKSRSSMGVRPCLPELTAGSLPFPETGAALDFELVFEPEWKDLPYPAPVDEPVLPETAAMHFEGGEEAALARLQYYLFETNAVAKYFDTRNGMLGPDYSTKLAPWLAFGCLSPRKIFEQIREYEKEIVANKSTYWVLFELMWRDFYRFFAAKHGRSVDLGREMDGRKHLDWKPDQELFRLWAEGKTGYPLVDANMRELSATGFMSNRGRQNVASFLALDMKLEHEPSWVYIPKSTEMYLHTFQMTPPATSVAWCGVKTPGRLDREDGAYLRHWLPELRRVPVRFIHEPWTMSPDEKVKFGAESYPPPCLDPSKFRDDASSRPRKKNRGWPKGIYPMSDGWVPPCYPKEEELIEYENRMNARKKATLVKRHLCIKEPQLQQLSKTEFAQKSEYSMLAYGIGEGEYSGEGDDRSYFVILYYEAAKKSKVERAFKSTGVELADYEQVVVDPDSKMEQEEKFMYAHGAGNAGECIVGEYEYHVVPKGSPDYDDPWGFIDGCYTPLAIDRLCEEIADSGGVDLLLTSEWPKGVMTTLKEAWPEEADVRKLAKGAARQCSSPAVAELAVAAEPKYHAVGLGGVFWRRQPWRHERRGEVEASTGVLKCGVCRMITLGAVDGSRPGVKDMPTAKYSHRYKKPEDTCLEILLGSCVMGITLNSLQLLGKITSFAFSFHSSCPKTGIQPSTRRYQKGRNKRKHRKAAVKQGRGASETSEVAPWLGVGPQGGDLTPVSGDRSKKL